MKTRIKDSKMGSMAIPANVVADITRFMIMNREDLSYEYMHGVNYRLAIITGKNISEKELPIWNHPIVIENKGDISYVAVDARGFVKPDKEFHKLKDIMKNEATFEFEMLRATIMLKISEGDNEIVTSNKRQLTVGYSLWLSKILANMLRLDPLAESRVALVVGYFMLLKINNEIDISDAAVILKNYNILFTMDVRGITEILKDLDYNTDTKVDLNLLESFISSVVKMEVKYGIVFNGLVNTWYGNNAHEVVGLSMDHIPTLLALLYTALDNRTFKNTKLTNILLNGKRQLDPVDLIKSINEFKKDMTID